MTETEALNSSKPGEYICTCLECGGFFPSPNKRAVVCGECILDTSNETLGLGMSGEQMFKSKWGGG